MPRKTGYGGAKKGKNFVRTSPNVIRNPASAPPTTIFTSVKLSNKSQR